jgi:hypothetical protein
MFFSLPNLNAAINNQSDAIKEVVGNIDINKELLNLEKNNEVTKIQEDMKQDADESISDCNGKTPALPDGKNLSGKANKYKKK